MKSAKKWTKFRHKIATNLVRPFFGRIAKRKYHATVDKFDGEGNRNWLVLANHQTDFDQFFVGMAFRRPIYYVAMEDVFSKGFVSRLIEWLVAPIPILKATTDLKAIKTCIRVAREGGTIALFPEGNRTYSGKTCYIKPGVASLAKKLGLPIAIFRIEGGYGVKPRWADNARNGEMHAGVTRVLEPAEYENLSKEEFYDLICNELQVNEPQTGATFESDRAAEGLERVLYVCPRCGIAEFETSGDTVTCKSCGLSARYTAAQRFEPLSGDLPFDTVAAWYDYQEAFIRDFDLTPYRDKPLFTDTVQLDEVIVFKKKKLLASAVTVRAFADRFEIEGDTVRLTLPFNDVKAAACIDDHKLNVFYGDTIYQLQNRGGFNALKYCNVYYHAKFVQGGGEDGEFQFLGL